VKWRCNSGHKDVGGYRDFSMRKKKKRNKDGRGKKKAEKSGHF